MLCPGCRAWNLSPCRRGWLACGCGCRERMAGTNAAECRKSHPSKPKEKCCDCASYGSEVQSIRRRNICYHGARYSDHHRSDRCDESRMDRRTYRRICHRSVLYTDRRSRRRKTSGCRAQGDATRRATWLCDGCGSRSQASVEGDGKRVRVKKGGRCMSHMYN